MRIVFLFIIEQEIQPEIYIVRLRCSERPAVFLRSLEDVVAEERGKACLQCEVSKQAVTPFWKKDGTVLNASEKYEILHLGKSLSLVIHKLRKDDAGEYSCDVGASQTKAKVVVRGESNLNSDCVFGSVN